MIEVNMSENNSFPDRLLKKLPTGFADDANGFSVDQLKKTIYQSEANIYTIEKEKEGDHKLNGAKDLIKELSAPYRDAKSAQTAKIKYCLWLLENKGEDLEKEE